MTLVLLEVADVLLAVGPLQVSFPVHLVVHPFAIVHFHITPHVLAPSLDLIQVELAFVH